MSCKSLGSSEISAFQPMLIYVPCLGYWGDFGQVLCWKSISIYYNALHSEKVFLNLVLFVPLNTYICCAWSHCVDCLFVNVYKCHAMLSIAAPSKHFSLSNVRLLVQGCVNNCFVSYRLPAARIKTTFQFFNSRKLDSLTNKTQKYEIEQFCKFRLGRHQDDVEVGVYLKHYTGAEDSRGPDKMAKKG